VWLLLTTSAQSGCFGQGPIVHRTRVDRVYQSGDVTMGAVTNSGKRGTCPGSTNPVPLPLFCGQDAGSVHGPWAAGNPE